MTGNNTLVLNHATVIEALQHYFKTVLYKAGACPNIKSINPNTVETTIHVLVCDKAG